MRYGNVPGEKAAHISCVLGETLSIQQGMAAHWARIRSSVGISTAGGNTRDEDLVTTDEICMCDVRSILIDHLCCLAEAASLQYCKRCVCLSDAKQYSVSASIYQQQI